LGPHQYHVCRDSAQEATGSSRRFRCRRCLLKGCERFFWPTHPRCHYCGESCRRQAKKWHGRKAGHTWRASEKGKKRRREQSRRYRRRKRLAALIEPKASSVEPPIADLNPPTEPVGNRLPSAEPILPCEPAAAEPILPPVPSNPAAAAEPIADIGGIADPSRVTASVSMESREGQRILTIPENFLIRMCHRPGCYELFGVASEYWPRRYCCDLCHKALRRVKDRDRRHQQRRRLGVRPSRRAGTRGPPKPRK
jgi:hypothetical protein